VTVPAYEQVCKRLVAKFADSTNPFVNERVVQDCLLLPNWGADLALMDKLADSALKTGSTDAALPYFQACKSNVELSTWTFFRSYCLGGESGKKLNRVCTGQSLCRPGDGALAARDKRKKHAQHLPKEMHWRLAYQPKMALRIWESRGSPGLWRGFR
jgi:hypothetical protein